MEILIATNNNHKVKEIRAILNFSKNKIITLKEAGFNEDIEETGSTYYDNSRIKAVEVRKKIKDKIILADDSGLEIDFFDGAPGLHSARFLPSLSQKEKNKEVIERLKNVYVERRTAKFISVVCCILPDGESHFFKGVCSGHISFDIQGEEGFGYDPIFIPSGFNKTFGILSEDVKNTISHRASAFLQTKNFLVYTGLLD
ncbi:RdgB/HAM1 family non-canonical purine NTP pyrophosphatase [Candidatus Dependentiae bacterium]|nr:RdgB/HAM1 family non-canonical purine NTP pyrophosphatase [Candidatus Dependentiae bacterium]